MRPSSRQPEAKCCHARRTIPRTECRPARPKRGSGSRGESAPLHSPVFYLPDIVDELQRLLALERDVLFLFVVVDVAVVAGAVKALFRVVQTRLDAGGHEVFEGQLNGRG